MKRYDFSLVENGINARIEKGILPGAAVCVNIGGERVYDYCAGYCDVEKRTPLAPDAIFRMCSMTKPITAAAVLIQQDRGIISVKDEVKKYLPDFANRKVGYVDGDGKVRIKEDAKRDMTIEDVLTHGSGLGAGPLHDATFPFELRSEGASLAEVVNAYLDMPLDFSPGESQFYSALAALDLAARIVEITSGMPYEDFIKKNIFDPLGMKDTGYTLSDEQKARMVPLYRLNDEGSAITRTGEVFGHQGFAYGSVSGATGLMSTLGDYSLFAEMLCGEGEYKGVRILSQNAVRAMRKPHYPDGFADMNGFFNWGYAVRVRSEAEDGVQELTPGSYGWSGAYNTHFWVDPVRKLTAVLMSNLDNAGGAGSQTAFEFECNVMRSLKKA